MSEPDDQARSVALALAVDICRECACTNRMLPSGATCYPDSPCPYFHSRNFYYDSEHKRFWCCNWVNERGEVTSAA